MPIYYAEMDNGHCTFNSKDDASALEHATRFIKNLMLLYTENNETSDGTPFVILYERDKNEQAI